MEIGMYIAGGSMIAIALAYIGVSIFFTRHFLMNTEINGYSFSGQSVSEAEQFFKEKVEEYSLVLKDINGGEESIRSDEILLSYKENGEIERVLEEQDAFTWPKAFFDKNKAEITFDVSYDDGKLMEKINSLGIIQAGQTPAQSAAPTAQRAGVRRAPPGAQAGTGYGRRHPGPPPPGPPQAAPVRRRPLPAPSAQAFACRGTDGIKYIS